MPTAWVEVRRPCGIINIITATRPPENHNTLSNQDCFCQLRIASGYIPVRLAHENIAILNQANRVVLERSVRASGGAKPSRTRKEEKLQHEDHCNEPNKLRQHASCATILIEEGHSIRLTTPLFQILPQITAATRCAAFLTSWKPNAIAASTAAPMIQVEADQHEPEDPLHRSTARAMAAIATQSQERGEPNEPPFCKLLDLQNSNPDWTGCGHATMPPPHAHRMLECRRPQHHTRLRTMHDRSRPLPIPSKERRLTIACVEVKDALAEDIMHIATCLSIDAIVLLFHTTHRANTHDHHNNNSTSGPHLNTRGHTPFVSGPVTEPFTIQHRGAATLQVTCNAFGIGLYDPDYDNQTLLTGCTRTSDCATTAPPRIKAVGLCALQDAIDAAQRSGTNTPSPDQRGDTSPPPNYIQEHRGKITNRSRSLNSRAHNAHGAPRTK